jgi:hypothetical protein
VVAVLVEGGEHGYLSGRLAAQVVKAYVEKQRAKQVNVASAAAAEKPSTPATAEKPSSPATAEKPPQPNPPTRPAATPEAAGAQPSQPEQPKPAPAPGSKPKPAEITGVAGRPAVGSPGWEITGVWGGTDGHMHGGRFRFSSPQQRQHRRLAGAPAESGKFQRLLAAPGMEQCAQPGNLISSAAPAGGNQGPQWVNLPELLAIVKTPHWDSRQMAIFQLPGWRSGGQR